MNVIASRHHLRYGREEATVNVPYIMPEPVELVGYLLCVAIFLDKDGLSPVVSRKTNADLLCLPGGKAEARDGEVYSLNRKDVYDALRNAAARELYEESGLIATPDDLELVFSSHDYERRRCHTFTFRAKRWSGVLRAEDGSTVRWADSHILLTQSPWPEYYEALFKVLDLDRAA